MRKTNRRRTNNRRRKTGKKQKKIRGGVNDVWMKTKGIPSKFNEFRTMQKHNTSTKLNQLSGESAGAYNNIYWHDGMKQRDYEPLPENTDADSDDTPDEAEEKQLKYKKELAAHHDVGIPHSENDFVTEAELKIIYDWMVRKGEDLYKKN